MPIMAPLGPLRATHAGEALLTYRRSLRGQLTRHTPEEQIARLYAARVIEVDDAYSRSEFGLVVASDQIWRADLGAMLRRGRPVADCGHEAPRLECDTCVIRVAWGRVAGRMRDRGTP